MQNTPNEPQSAEPAANPPIFNIPTIILVCGVLLVIIHAVISMVLDRDAYIWVLTVFSFIPAAYDVTSDQLLVPLSRYWSPITYAFLHGDWAHLFFNLVWFAAFGTAVARRFSTVGFVVFLACSAIAGAGAHIVFHAGELVPVIGASAAVSACMGAVLRFGLDVRMPAGAAHRPALSILGSFSNRNILTFAAIWFAMNYLFGSGVVAVPGAEGSIAWEAHVGGFLFGWLTFGAFDPVKG